MYGIFSFTVLTAPSGTAPPMPYGRLPDAALHAKRWQAARQSANQDCVLFVVTAAGFMPFRVAATADI